MRLPLTYASDRPRAGDDQIEVTEREMTAEESAYYDTHGWDLFRRDHFIDRRPPSLGAPVLFGGRNSIERGVVVEIRGTRYRVAIEDLHTGEVWEPKGKTLVLDPTTEPLTPSDVTGSGFHYIKMFGYPVWVQNEWFPLDPRGAPCYHLLTLENGWGDARDRKSVV